MLFILEMANNHAGSIERGKEIIREFHKVTSKYPQFEFAFKFQRRNIDKIIHKDFQGRLDLPVIKRLTETAITLEQLKELKEYAESKGFITICTPFDEQSVEDVITLDFNYIKIGSCSANDWSLLNKIAQYNKPVIASVGGLLFEEIDKLHMFFKNRDIPLSLLHCVGLYPTKANEQALEYISDLHNRYPKTVIGLSSHGCPENWEEIIIGIAKDIEIYERHVDLEHKNTYSLTPLDLDTYLKVALKTWNMLYGALEIKKQKEGLRSSFMRGAYLKRDIAPNELITQDDLYFALPIIDATHLDGSECSKYITFQALCELKKDEPLLSTKIIKHNTRPEILDIMTYTKQVLKDGQIILPKNMKCEISHHYGLFNWDKYGMVLITLINQQYCKKLLILQAGQKNPEHYHKEKLETFFVLYGTAIVEVDGIIHKLKQGNMITIQPGQKHYISTDGDSDVIIEELSTNHKPNDSYYTDETITTNKHRKTEVYLLND